MINDLRILTKRLLQCVVEMSRAERPTLAPTRLDFNPVHDNDHTEDDVEKLLYVARATRGHRFCGVSATPGGRGSLLLVLFLG